jgi:alanine racemase
MSRLGLLPEETRAFITELQAPANLSCEGVYTHFAKADDLDSGSIDLQMTSFRKVLDDFNANGVQLSEIHYANSAAIMRHRMERCTMVRPGIALYGCKPNPAQDFPLDLKPVLCMKGRVLKMKRVTAGVAVSYGGTYVTASDTTIATIGLGYGQGLPRQLGNKGAVLIRGRRFGIVGRVTMDYIMVDAGADPHFSVGDEVVAIGNQGNESIHPDEIALLCNTIAYEILCSINSSIDRQYILNGKVIHHEPCKPF